jgi:hypothetical protein
VGWTGLTSRTGTRATTSIQMLYELGRLSRIWHGVILKLQIENQCRSKPAQ